MFPFDVELETEDVVQTEQKIPSDYEIDFETMKLTGRIISGLDAIKQWVKIALMTERYFYSQYSWQFGSELNTLIGTNYSEELTKSEVKRMIEDTLSIDDNILSVDDFACSFEKGILTATFSIDTKYGRGEINV